METRLDALGTEVAPKIVKHLSSAHRALAATGLPGATIELVNVRVSQINGCAFCLDMHTKEAIAAGETPLRLALVAAWREATVFTEAERAALELAEQGTRLADAGDVDDDVWAAARKHYDDEQLMALVAQIALINAFNRLNVILRRPGGDYEVGQYG